MTAVTQSPSHSLLPARTAVVTGPRTAHVSTVAGLTAIYQDDINLVVLQRTLSAAAQSAVGALAEGSEFTATAQVAAAQPDLSCLLPAGRDDTAPLLADIRFWIEVYAELFDADRIGLRICHSRSVMCPRFHIDRVPVRLVCAYAGPSLQWLAEPDIDRSFLGHSAGGRSDEESGLIRRPGAIQQVLPQAIVLCRGEAWPEQAGRASVHRSPPLPPDGSGRIVMTLDIL